jgi:hypothetical protein
VVPAMKVKEFNFTEVTKFECISSGALSIQASFFASVFFPVIT